MFFVINCAFIAKFRQFPIMNDSAIDHHYSICMLLLPGYNSLAANAMIDPFRAANYIQGQARFRWDWVGQNDSAVTASNGQRVDNVIPFSNCRDRYDFVVINASWTPENYNHGALSEWLTHHVSHGSTLVGVDTGAFVLGYAGLIDGYRVTVHYEHIAAFRELFPAVDVSDELYTIDRKRMSCCGGHATTDLALEIIRNRTGIDLANAAARYIFHERLRPPSETQQSALIEPVGYAAPGEVREAIMLMERNLEEPLILREIADHTGLSLRQFERVFKSHTGVSPIRYYIDVRLDRGRGLLTQTNMNVMAIATACGFKSSENFSRAYRKRFGLSPGQDRKDGRIPFHFRSFPSHAGLSDEPVARGG